LDLGTAAPQAPLGALPKLAPPPASAASSSSSCSVTQAACSAAPSVAAVTSSTSAASATSASNNTFAVGDTVWRKGEEAVVVKIDITMEPPSYTVRMSSDGREVGTEAKNLQPTAGASQCWRGKRSTEGKAAPAKDVSSMNDLFANAPAASSSSAKLSLPSVAEDGDEDGWADFQTSTSCSATMTSPGLPTISESSFSAFPASTSANAAGYSASANGTPVAAAAVEISPSMFDPLAQKPAPAAPAPTKFAMAPRGISIFDPFDEKNQEMDI